jgi:glycosyltransferase involved in cell wall biosynthesis
MTKSTKYTICRSTNRRKEITMKAPRIHAYTLAWNEEMILPHFLRHYGRFCERIVVFDNESSDATASIVDSCPVAERRVWSSNNQINELMYLDIKNSAYRESRGVADWVIVCDADEFLYHPELTELLASYQRRGITMPRVRGYEMVGTRVPGPTENLLEQFRLGAPNTWMDKQVVFSPNLDFRFGVGAHAHDPVPGARRSWFRRLKLLHYKMFTPEQYIERTTLLRARLSELNLRKNWGTHYLQSIEELRLEHQEWQKKAHRVV